MDLDQLAPVACWARAALFHFRRGLADRWCGGGLNRDNWRKFDRHGSGGAHFAAPTKPETAGSTFSSRSSAALGTSNLLPMRMTGISPRRTASYAVFREQPRISPASSTLTVIHSPLIFSAPKNLRDPLILTSVHDMC